MSHFSVMVIGEDVDGQLAAYQENCGDMDGKWPMEFDDREAECREEYENGSSERIVLADGTMKYPWDNSFKSGGPIGLQDTKYPEGSEKRDVPYKEIYPTFEGFMEDYHNLTANEAGRYGYWQNPNAKWDWYQLGGRWRGELKAKPGAQKVLSGEGYPNVEGTHGNLSADQLRKGDIDIEGMEKAEMEAAAERYDRVFELYGGQPQFPERSWKEIRDFEEDPDKCREIYWDQPAMKHWRKVQNDRDFAFARLSDYTCTREEYIEAARKGTLVMFAIVKDGEWFEKGSMGWFGFVGDEKDPGVWRDEFHKIFSKLPDDTLISIVDCHI